MNYMDPMGEKGCGEEWRRSYEGGGGIRMFLLEDSQKRNCNPTMHLIEILEP